jgi:beta-glucosidase
VARRAAAESQVLLKNDGVLPLSKTAHVYVAGANADDLGNQAGGWTITWQGSSGTTTQGTTILQGIKQVAPGATVTYSKDASAPMAGNDVGVVVVGETPYAEGVGDIGNGHSFALSSADQTAISRVCGAMKCVVLLVSGRPLPIGPQLAQANAFVASWLPGTEGEGVADTLFGDKPFTGRLPVTWPRSEAQLPINVGDANYDPQLPFGWGLRTDAAKARLQGVRSSLGGDALAQLDALLAADDWNADGSVSKAGDVLARLTTLAGAIGDQPFAVQDAIVSVARDIAQAAMVKRGIAAADSSLTADAEHAVLSGDPQTAVRKFAAAANVSVSTPGGVGGTVPATLAVALGTAPSFGSFTPGSDHTYTATTTATVTSTAGDALLTVADPDTANPNHLVNGAYVLHDPLTVNHQPLPAALKTWAAPVSNDVVAVEFEQHIGSTDPLRTGTYAKTLTFTLSTTNP